MNFIIRFFAIGYSILLLCGCSVIGKSECIRDSDCFIGNICLERICVNENALKIIDGPEQGLDSGITNADSGMVDLGVVDSGTLQKEPLINEENAFITTWNTNACSSSLYPKEIRLYADKAFDYDFNIDWGDGSPVQEHVETSIKHEYAREGIYVIKIDGKFPHLVFPVIEKDFSDGTLSLPFMFPEIRDFNEETMSYDIVAEMTNLSDESFKNYCPNKLVNISQWGVHEWKSMTFSFAQSQEGISMLAEDAPTFLAPISFHSMFYRANGFKQAMTNWDLSKVNNMSYMFYRANGHPDAMNSWDVSNVTDMSHMFHSDRSFDVFSFESIASVSSWDTSKVTDMRYMFYEARGFDDALDAWNVSNVTDMSYMFYAATDFNQNLMSWNVSKVADVSHMFQYAYDFNGNITSWDVSNVTNMSYMLHQTLFDQDISAWNVSNVIDMSGLFEGLRDFNRSLISWNVSNVTDMNHMFSDTRSFNQSLDTWDFSNVTDMSSMFKYADHFNQPLDSWNVSNVTNMESMFRKAESFNQSLASWNISNVMNMSAMLDEVKLSNDNYDLTLASWSVLSLKDNVIFSAGISQYCSSAEAKQFIMDNFSWQIEDGGMSANRSNFRFDCLKR